MSWRNEFYNEQQLYGKGCYIHNIIKTDTVGFELDSIQLPPDGRYKGSFWSAMARFDMQGNMLWCRRFAHGEFHHVIQNEEGNLVAIGMTQSTIDKNEDSLIYNPGLNNFKLGCYSDSSARRMYVVETDLNGNMLANYVYGNYEDDGVALRIESFGWTLTAVPPGNLLDSGGYLFVGYHQNSNSAKSNQGFVVLANRDLEMVDKQSVSLNEFEECELRAVARYGDSTATLYAFGGFHKDSSLDVKDAFVMVWSDDGTELFNKRIKDPLSFHRHGKVTDISFSNDGDIYLPTLFENGWYKWDGYVYKLDPQTGNCTGWGSPCGLPDNPIYVGETNTYDNQLGITPPKDNLSGFAIVTSRHASDPHDSIDPYLPIVPSDSSFWMYNGYEINFFEDANGFIAKYADSGSFAQLVWELEFDIDDSVTAIGTQTQREYFPGDVKKQECLYSITQNSDGGYTAAGNCSPNLDDGYLVNFKGDCGFDKNYSIDHYQWDDLFITSNVTWDSAHFNSSTASIRGVVIVDNGGTLIIDGMLLEFADTRSCGYQTNITVLEGGHLFVKNSTLTSSSDCDPNACWDGIQVRGDNEESHNTTDQGKITLKNCTIQNSSSGICLGRKEYRNNLYWAETQTMGGGIIHADSSVFLNNRFSIHFSPYFYSITNPYSNTSYFANCDFINSAPIPAYGELGMSNFVSILEVRDINFLGCHFKNTMAEAVDSAMGSAIGGFNCGFNIISSPQRTSLFSGLRYGIEAGQSNLTAAAFPIDIRNTLFSKNWRAIYLTNSHWPIIAQNEFQVGFTGISASYGNSYGLYLHNCQEYKVEDNIFFDNGNVESTGLLVYNTSDDSLSNRIYANSFEKFAIASIGMNQNRGYNEFTGLKFLCNDYTDNAYAIHAGSGNEPGISELQGTKTPTGGGGYMYTTAGNCFDGCTESDGYFYNDADSIHYIEHITDDCRKLSNFLACYTSSDIFITTLTENESINPCNEYEHTDDRPSRNQDPVKFLEEEISDLEKKQFAISPNSIEYENLEALKDQFIGEAVSSAIRQKNKEGLEKSIALLKKSDKWSRKISMADLLTQNGQYDEALSILLELEREYDHLSSWVNLKMIMSEYVRTKKARSEITEDPNAMETINYLASDFSLYGSMSARVLLAELNGSHIPEVFPPKPLPVKKEISPEITSDVKAVIKCFPNPFTKEVTINYKLPEGINSAEVEMYNLNGILIMEKSLSPLKDQIRINGSGLRNGMYYVVIKSQNEIYSKFKVVKIE